MKNSFNIILKALLGSPTLAQAQALSHIFSKSLMPIDKKTYAYSSDGFWKERIASELWLLFAGLQYVKYEAQVRIISHFHFSSVWWNVRTEF